MPPATLRASFSFFWRHLRDRESSSPRVGNPRVGVSASCPVTVAEYMHVHQHAKLVDNSSMAHTESQWSEFKD